MNNTDFIIEVKTKWIKKDNKYVREIIEYSCNKEFEDFDESIYVKYLTPTTIKEETTNNIITNSLEIMAKEKSTNQIIENPSKIIKILLDFTKFQWTKGE